MSAEGAAPAALRAKGVWLWLAFASVSFHLYLIFSGLVSNLVSRPLHMALALPWVFVLSARGSRMARGVACLLCVVGVAGCLYVVFNRHALDDQYGTLAGPGQSLIAWSLIVVVLEMARRAIKAALPTVAALALAYALYGEYLPGEFGHPGIPWSSVLGTLTITEGGLWGQLTGVSVNVVAVFVILGAFISAGEGGTGFMSLATWLAGGLKAGAAKVTVLSSALFGSISGSASANVASTGAITLPTMKRLGYPLPLAAAVEAVASSGGQIMPPLMGAGAFIMVELLRIRYTDVMRAALLPAVLFFAAAWIGVDLFARRYGLRPMQPADRAGARDVLATLPFFLAPFSVLLAVLFMTARTPQYAAALAIGVAAALLWTDRYGRFEWRAALARNAAALTAAAGQIATIAAIILCAGIVIGVLNMTGLGVKVTSVIIGLAGGQLWIALLLTALACLILGMEVPTTAAYVICVSVAGPALINLGLPALEAHLFVFWYALLSTITPPVCGAVFIAAGMLDTSWVKTAGHAMRIGVGLYLVPLAFVANPALVAPVSAPLAALVAMVKVIAGLWLIGRGLIDLRAGAAVRLAQLAAGLGVIFLYGL